MNTKLSSSATRNLGTTHQQCWCSQRLYRQCSGELESRLGSLPCEDDSPTIGVVGLLEASSYRVLALVKHTSNASYMTLIYVRIINLKTASEHNEIRQARNNYVLKLDKHHKKQFEAATSWIEFLVKARLASY